MENLILIRTLRDFKNLRETIQDSEYVAFDTETTGLHKEAEIIGFSVCADINESYYIILSEWDIVSSTLRKLETYDYVIEFLEFISSKKLIMHNSIFDCWKVETNFNISLIKSVHTDTMLLAHITDENRRVGLKDLGVSMYGEDSKKEQAEMKESILQRGGKVALNNYELYKADPDVIGRYGAKDALLTLKLFYSLVPTLFKEGLDSFFYDDEIMPLLKGPTYDLNTAGLQIDSVRLERLRKELEAECEEAKALIYEEIRPYVLKKYPGTNPRNTFNIGSSKQLSWLLFGELQNEFISLTKGGKELCKSLNLKVPYTAAAKKEFLETCRSGSGVIYESGKYNYKTSKMGRAKKIAKEPWAYIECSKASLIKYADKYKWVAKLLEYGKNLKLLNTYVEGIQSRASYNVIRPSFLQHGTTSGRYSSRNPNFQNLPKKDKRIKECITARPGRVFVGADYSQLEPRVFASLSNDSRLLECFSNGDDFYSVIGVELFDKYKYSLKKDDRDSFASIFPGLRDIAKTVGLSSTYGTTAFKMAPIIKKTIDEAQEVIDKYFEKFPQVQDFMKECHSEAKAHGVVYSLYGRPRRLLEAKSIEELFGDQEHSKLPYATRNILNLAVNHKVQSTAASIMNLAAIRCYDDCRKLETMDAQWKDVKIVLQVHDELVLEGPEHLAEGMSLVLKDSMENAVVLPGVALEAVPKTGKNLAELKD